MVLLREQPFRSSLQVAPLTILKNKSGSVNHALTSQRASTNPYSSHSEMTPPTTPDGSQEDLNPPSNPPPVFHSFLRAFYPFHPSYAMTGSAVTLPLNEGDVVLVHSIHTNGWADGTLLVSGARGWLPTNYCYAYDPDEVRNLLKALLNFWDLCRSTAVNDNEIFGNQEFMKGIIAGVRYLLERTNCLTRESSVIQRHEGLRRGRKSLLSELSSLVKTAKVLQEQQKLSTPIDEVNNTVDEMILKAFKIVTKGVRFLDVLEEDRQTRAPAVTLMPTVLEENYVPPTPPADQTTFDDDQSTIRSAGAGSRVADYRLAPGSPIPEPSDEAQTADATNGRLSTGRSGTSSQLSQNNQRAVNFSRLSSNIAHRVSLAGPSPLSRPQNLVSERLTSSHDTFLSHLGSFIGRLHLQSQARPYLALAIKQSATSGGELLVVVDVVCAHSSLTKELLEQPRAAMYDRILDLVHAASDILLYNSGPEMADIILPQDNSRLLSAATGCVRATGECVAKTKWVIERIGDFELEFEDGSFGIDLDLGALDAIEEERERSGSMVSISETRAPTYPTFSKPLPKDKPLPEVPRKSSPSTEGPQSLAVSIPPRRDSLRFSDSNTSDSTTSVSSLRPKLPPLPKLSTSALPAEDYSPSDNSAGLESDGRSSFQRESLVATSSATGSSNLNRDSETSLLSQTSTRATTPDVHHAPKLQPSISELSSTSNSGEEVEEVECKLMEKTYAHELMFNKEGQVVGGSLPALVERLTTHEATPDAIFVSTFFLTFRLFCTPTELVEALVDRFEYVGDAPRMAGPVRLRVYNVFKQWLESHWRDETDHDALSLIQNFAETNLASALPSANVRLLDLIQRVSATHATLVPRLVSSVGKGNTSVSPYVAVNTPMPAPALTKSQANSLTTWKAGGSCPAILDFDPLEVARQLTVKQMSIFCSILPEELLGSQWMKKGGAGSPNVKAMTALSTDLSNYVAETILHYNEVKKRAAVIKQWIKIGHQCLELHNYDALMAIICSLNSSTITRLRKTWDIVSPKRREMLKALQAVVEPAQNHKALRGQLAEHVPPCLPFQGMFLTDLTFVDIGNPATKQLQGADGKDMTVINYDKHSRTAKIIGELQRFQVSYRLTELPDMQDWIQAELDRVRESDPKKNVQVSYYRKSLLLEPRETQGQRTPVESPGSTNSQNMFSWRKTGIRSEKS
ncbi:Cell division control protein 25 [Cytospora mali]|uniref:Cell division control protein 25 n=1 Tax=Cytospora mali TaxID=578113 RepID=A0A194VUV8_CYTMA|nr:Cell division control protein 25 [Valsa mali]